MEPSIILCFSDCKHLIVLFFMPRIHWLSSVPSIAGIVAGAGRHAFGYPLYSCRVAVVWLWCGCRVAVVVCALDRRWCVHWIGVGGSRTCHAPRCISPACSRLSTVNVGGGCISLWISCEYVGYAGGWRRGGGAAGASAARGCCSRLRKATFDPPNDQVGDF